MRDGNAHGASTAHAEGTPHVLPLRTYLAVFLALLVGTAITTWVSTIDLGRLNDVVALGVACAKAALVVLYFMHLRYAIRMVWVFALSGLVWLVLLFVITLSDYQTRVVIQGWGG